MFVALDTNTLASGALSTEGSPPTLILNAWREGRFTLVISTDILTELERTLAKPYFASHIPTAEIVALKALLLQYAQLQRLETFQGVHILTPRQFLALLPKIEDGGGDA